MLEMINGMIDVLFENLLVIVPPITAGLTALFVIILFVQTQRQKEERDLTIRPIIVHDKDLPLKSMQMVPSETNGFIEIRLVNAGNIPAGKIRIMLLPLDEYARFMTRECALKEYLKEIGNDNLKKTDSCMLLRPIRERMKRIAEHNSFENYLVLGDDFKKLDPVVKKFESTLNKSGSKEEKKKFDDAGLARAESLAKLNHTDWDKFYLAGNKRGDLLDKTGPVDWEIFDSKISQKVMRAFLGEYADEIYDTAPARTEILEKMSEEDRKQYDTAIEKRLDVWNSFPFTVAQEFVETSMNLRRIYKKIKDIKSLTEHMLPPNHTFELKINLDEKDPKNIASRKHLYFGVLVQYSKLGKKEMEYTYYMRGYVDDSQPYLDYSSDAL